MNRNRIEAQETLICTLGVEPQVVTIALDQLLAQGNRIKRLSLVYTNEPRVIAAFQVIQQELSVNYPDVEPVDLPVEVNGEKVEDFRSEADIKALLHTMYREIHFSRQKSWPIHLCVSGGRKVMGILAMVAAQLLFGPNDQVWHLLTEGWNPGSERKLHLSREEEVRLVPIPVLRLRESNLLMKAVMDLGDPESLLEWQCRLENNAQMKRRSEFIQRWLTTAEKEVVRLACQGLSNTAIAGKLHKQQQTVANQLSKVFEKFAEWQGSWETPDRAQLVAEFAPYFTLVENDK